MLEKYKSKSEKSSNFWKRAVEVFPGGINHNIRQFGLVTCGAYPAFMQHGEGSHVWDVDGNEYIDFWMTHMAQILGHNNPKVREALQKQLENGVHLGAVNEYQVEFAEKIKNAIPFMQKMRFTSTGSESTMYASRVARLFTGKPLLAKALCGWHGGNDSLAYHLKYPFTDEPLCAGVSFNYNDRESVDKILKKHGDEMAAVIIEPVLGGGGGLPSTPEFLSYLREETESRDILLIFDEIITGFRFCYGSAGKDIFGVEPDLITLGKIVAGGMPLGVYGGREDVMSLAAPKAEGGRWVGGGTFSSHPLTMVAGIASLNELKEKSDYVKLNKLGDAFRDRVTSLFETEKFNAIMTGMGSLIFIIALKKDLKDEPITSHDLSEATDMRTMDYLQGTLLDHGIFGYHGFGGLSFQHSEEDIEKAFDAISSTIQILKSQ